MSRKTPIFTLILFVLILSGCAAVLAAPADQPSNPNATIRFEVAEDMSRFVFDDAPVFEEDGYPAYGNSFITQGYIYPEGTLTCNEEGCNGVNADGSPEFPEEVIGEWTCRGWFVGDGAHTAEGPMVITTQVYNFGEEVGDEMLISEGYELMAEAPFHRAITGGTGRFAGRNGQLEQTFRGFNASEGVVLSFDLSR